MQNLIYVNPPSDIIKVIKNRAKQDKLLINRNEIIKEFQQPKKGHLCSVNGNNYEKTIHNIVKHCTLYDKKFNIQSENELGKSSLLNDLECNYINNKDIGIEAKKYNTPDWMQCVIKYNSDSNKWQASDKSKIPKQSIELFNTLINDIKLYDNEIPPFMKRKITHEEWLLIKQNTDKWNDYYIDIPNDTIKKMYNAKKCQYIQISEYGLYHLENDICKFNVPEFIVEQQLRIRTKIHTRKNTKGFCNLSVTIACQPKNIKKLVKSLYSLDSIDKLPQNIIYNFNQ